MRPKAGCSDSEVSAVWTHAQAGDGVADGAGVGVLSTSGLERGHEEQANAERSKAAFMWHHVTHVSLGEAGTTATATKRFVRALRNEYIVRNMNLSGQPSAP